MTAGSLLGIRVVPTKEAVWVLALLEQAIELSGVPPELMSDDGRPFEDHAGLPGARLEGEGPGGSRTVGWCRRAPDPP
jgi:hypothetical protein